MPVGSAAAAILVAEQNPSHPCSIVLPDVNSRSIATCNVQRTPYSQPYSSGRSQKVRPRFSVFLPGSWYMF